MANLDQYLSRERGRQSQLAQRLGLGAGTLSAIRNGHRRPSADLAKRIEDATEGEVRAATLLGVEEPRASFDPELAPHSLNDGRWSVVVQADGALFLPADVVASFGFSPSERLVLHPQEDGVRVASSDKALRRIQARLKALVPPGVSVVDEFIAEKRAEAERE